MIVPSCSSFVVHQPEVIATRKLSFMGVSCPRGRTRGQFAHKKISTATKLDRTENQLPLRQESDIAEKVEILISEARATATQELDEIFFGQPAITMLDDRVARRFERIMDRFLAVCAKVHHIVLPSEAVENMKEDTRRCFEDVWLGGGLGFEIVKWPRGMGSAKAMQLIYEGPNFPTSSLKAHYSERYLRHTDLAHAVRGRKDTLRDILGHQISQRQGSTIRLLDLGNGPCSSLKELIPTLSPAALKSLSYTGVDRDESAQNLNNQFIQEYGCADQFTFLTKNVFRFDIVDGGPWDICFSTGLFDYLQDATLVKLWSRIYESLSPNGVAIISVKDSSRYNPEVYHWVMKWDGFLQRTPEQFDMLLEKAGILGKVESVIREPTGIIMFFVIRKP